MRTVPFLFSLLLLTILAGWNCSKDDNTIILQTIAPNATAAGQPVLMVSDDFVDGGISINFDGLEAVIDTVVPSGDSIVAIIPAGVNDGSVELTARSNAGVARRQYDILDATSFANLPATPPNFVFPGGSNIGLPVISNDAPATIELVNVQDVDHIMTLPVISSPLYPAGASNVSCDFQTERLNGQTTCISITYFDVSLMDTLTACALENGVTLLLDLDIARQSNPDRFIGQFFDNVSVEISPEVKALLEDRTVNENTRNRFLILTSQIDNRQYVFAVYGGTRDDDLLNIFCG